MLADARRDQRLLEEAVAKEHLFAGMHALASIGKLPDRDVYLAMVRPKPKPTQLTLKLRLMDFVRRNGGTVNQTVLKETDDGDNAGFADDQSRSG